MIWFDSFSTATNASKKGRAPNPSCSSAIVNKLSKIRVDFRISSKLFFTEYFLGPVGDHSAFFRNRLIPENEQNFDKIPEKI